MLIGIVGGESSLNRKLMLYASKNLPSLVIDCANAANPHSLFPAVDLDKLGQIYVIELELLYKFRDVLLRVPSIIRRLGIKCVIVTTSDHLFNYQDELENHNVMEHAWHLMKIISKKHNIIVGIKAGSVHLKFASKYCDKLGRDNGTHCFESKNDGRHYTIRA